ncbi:DNA-binding protein [Paenibacillus yonginensis]|uniref:DNA-binding protein n=3 Tax=Paenibacillus TaxID=44249 RepID=A0A1B1MYN1_9BACL|nr:DNA-binding protein [Paenibacillus yonginensis]GGA47749.1 transcriptional regulator [Paenibacillus physcomitrellae]
MDNKFPVLKNRMPVLRAECQWTQKDLAEKVGVSRQTIISVEKGKFTPSLILGFQIAKAFGVDINEVFQLETGEEE